MKNLLIRFVGVIGVVMTTSSIAVESNTSSTMGASRTNNTEQLDSRGRFVFFSAIVGSTCTVGFEREDQSFDLGAMIRTAFTNSTGKMSKRESMSIDDCFFNSKPSASFIPSSNMPHVFSFDFYSETGIGRDQYSLTNDAQSVSLNISNPQGVKADLSPKVQEFPLGAGESHISIVLSTEVLLTSIIANQFNRNAVLRLSYK